MWYNGQTGGGPSGSSSWSGWMNFNNGRTIETVPVVRHNDGTIEAVVTSADGSNQVGHNWQYPASQGAGFSGWYNVSTNSPSSYIDPSAQLNAQGGTEAFVRGTDDVIYHAWHTDGTSSMEDQTTGVPGHQL